MELDQPTIARIALEAQLDPRTVKRAAARGIDSLKSGHAKVRLRDALKKLKCEAAFRVGNGGGRRR
jgi:hypothetical protein